MSEVYNKPELESAWAWRMGDSIFFDLEQEDSLIGALGYRNPEQMPHIISFVGGGGKTTSMNRLALELAEKGFKVLVTTTTHIGCPETGQVYKGENASDILNITWESNILTVGKPMKLETEGFPNKLSMMNGLDDSAVLEKLLEISDFILIEADGAKRLPLKIPADHEPVLIPQTGLVIACVGLSSVGRTFESTCFRFADKGSWLMRQADDRIEPEDISLILMDQRGSRKNLDGRYYKIILNQADTKEDLNHAKQIICALPATLQSGVVVTRYKK
ncbi:MAG: selenium cofactor biosynthesis protein YqeC [Brotaphodocola sp.]